MNDDLHSRLHALGDSPDLNRPLDDLDAVVRRARARRQRSGRMLAGGLAVALVVAGTAAALPRLSNDPQPAVDTVSPDAPAACQTAPRNLPLLDNRLWSNDATAIPTIDPNSLVAPTSGEWHVDLALDLSYSRPEPGVPPHLDGWTYGTTVALVQDDAVVAVMDTFAAPTIVEAEQMAVDVVPKPTPLLTELDAPMISCRTGEPAELEPGDYDLVATVTAGFVWVAATTNWDETIVVRRTTVPVAVTVSDDTEPTGPLACGAPDDELRALADPRTNPAPIVVSGDSLPTSVMAGDGLSVPVTFTNDSPDDITAQGPRPTAVVTQDGKIVGDLGVVDSTEVVLQIPAGGDAETDAVSGQLLSCPSDDGQHTALPPGDYELWVTTSLTPLGPTGFPAGGDLQTWRPTGGPWPLEITPAPGGDEGGEGTSFLKCGTTTDELAALAAATAESTLTLTRAETSDTDTMAVRITNEGDETIELAVEMDSGGVAREGRIVGGGGIQMRSIAKMTVLEPGDSMIETVGVVPTHGCDGALPGGTYDGWVMITVLVDGARRSLALGPIDVELSGASGDLTDRLVCGDVDDLLTSRPHAANPDVTITAVEMPSSLARGETLSFDVRITNESDAAVEWRADLPLLALTRDGGVRAIGGRFQPLAAISLDPGESAEYGPAWVDLTDCTGEAPLPAGDYEVWSVMSLGDSNPLVGGPWPLTITES